MPIYEYKCLKCQNEFETMQKISEEPLKRCITCGGPVKRLISRSSFHLKGSGWYMTDYAKKNTPTDTHESKSTTETSTTETPADKAPSSDD